jgi:hypothetical protein
MPKPITAYQCDFCSTKAYRESTVKRHESACVYNPKNKACPTCKGARSNGGNCDDVHGSGLAKISAKCRFWKEA